MFSEAILIFRVEVIYSRRKTVISEEDPINIDNSDKKILNSNLR